MPSATYVELRIHGVIGTPPEDMLQSVTATQVAGDGHGRFFRPSDGQGQEIRSDENRILECYHWGRLTSGSLKQAFWLILVPFGLVNAAYFMLPRPGRTGPTPGRWPRLLARGALRALGALVTTVSVIAVTEALVDVIAWQWTSLVPADRLGPRLSDPRVALAAALTVSALTVVAFRFLGAKRQEIPDWGRWTPPEDIADRTDLVRPEFLEGDRDVPSLRRLHAAAGSAVVGCVATDLALTGPGDLVAEPAFLVGVGLVLTAIVLAALIGDPRGPRGPWQAFGALTAPRLVQWAAVLYAATAVVAVLRTNSYPTVRSRSLPSLVLLSTGMVVLAVVALLVLGGCCAVLARRTPEAPRPRGFGRFLGGMTAWAVASIGVYLGVGMFAAVVYGVYRAFRPSVDPGRMSLAPIYVRLSYAWGLTAVLLVLVVATTYAVRRRAERDLRGEVAYEHNLAPFTVPCPDVGTARLGPAAVRSLTNTWLLARLKFGVATPVAVLAVAGLLMSLAAGIEIFVAGLDEGELARCGGVEAGWFGWLSSCVDRPGPELVSIGTVTLYALAAALVLLGRRSLRNTTTRRATSIIWDLVSFWPTAAHPLVPTNYSPKVIEDLRRRIAYHLGLCSELAPTGPCTCPVSPEPVERVVIAAHSQGSLIAVAALGRLQEASRSRVSLLTFGSQLQVAYSRAFPAYVNFPFLQWIHETAVQRHWISLYRETDPIGGPVLSWDRTTDPGARVLTSRRLRDWTPQSAPVQDEVVPCTGVRRCGDEWRLLDPTPTDGQRAPFGPVLGHSAYFADPAWPIAVGLLASPAD